MDDLIARARRVAEVGGVASSCVLLALADRVEELEGLLREGEWNWRPPGAGRLPGLGCGFCGQARSHGHAPGCRLARALGKEASDG